MGGVASIVMAQPMLLWQGMACTYVFSITMAARCSDLFSLPQHGGVNYIFANDGVHGESGR